MVDRSHDEELERNAINVVRSLAMDAPHAARSGHQGTAMALAPVAHVLFSRIMRYDAAHPTWPDRDRFILSCGHASILQYSYLHLLGFGLTLDDLRQFRQWGSLTPGHPEAGHTAGVEVTTGPLGQGFANGVGCALAERLLRAEFGEDLCRHRTFVLASDGDLAEGLSHEAASLAGHLGLGGLVVVYDDNRITIDGPTELSLSDDPAGRFRSYGWNVVELHEAGEDLELLERALREAADVNDRPSLLILRTHIGYPSPTLTDSPEAHGLAFDEAAISATKQLMGVPDEPFHIPDEVADFYRSVGRRGRADRQAWLERFEGASPEIRSRFDAVIAGNLLDGWEKALPVFELGEKPATRVAFQRVLNSLTPFSPGLVAGSADLTGNTGVRLTDAAAQSSVEPGGRQLHFGVREHAMGSVAVGLAQHGGVIPVVGTFLVFSDYMRPAVRMAALSSARVVFAWSHDSVGVGEDGPTHQPIEHLMALRAIPELQVIRPADGNEVAAALAVALRHEGPTAVVTSRQNTPTLEGTANLAAGGVDFGAYVLVEPTDEPQAVLVGTGTEVAVCVAAAGLLAATGIPVRVVSMPCWERFCAHTTDERAEVLPPGLPTVSVEAGVTLGWERFADVPVGIDRFGVSAPGSEVLARLGITPERVVDEVRALLAV